MCGRYAASASVSEIVEEFGVGEVVDAPPGPRFNIAPTDVVATVVERADKETGEVTRKLVTPRWGLVPPWSKGPQRAASMINARVETVAEKPAFRKPFAARRCLLPADGYYEWYPATDARTGKPYKQPFYIHPETGPFAMAGIYDFWKSPEGEWLTSVAIITTQATDELGHIHDRMPMTVARDAWGAWLDPHQTDAQQALPLLEAPAHMEAYAVSRLVSSVRNDGPELLAPLAEEG